MTVSGFTMNLFCRLSSLGFAYADGGLDESKIHAHMKTLRVKEKPSVLEMFSYSFFGPGATLGTFFEFIDFKNYIELRGHYKNIPSPVYYSIRRLVEAIRKQLKI